MHLFRLQLIRMNKTMSKLLFRMRDVPEDEANEVRDLLKDNNIDYFETFAGNWGISMPALWVKDLSEYHRARRLLDEYEATRAARMRQAYEENYSEGESKTWLQLFLDRPFQFIAYWALIITVFFISVYYFFNLGE